MIVPPCKDIITFKLDIHELRADPGTQEALSSHYYLNNNQNNLNRKL